jgi:hypothetical protein
MPCQTPHGDPFALAKGGLVTQKHADFACGKVFLHAVPMPAFLEPGSPGGAKRTT